MIGFIIVLICSLVLLYSFIAMYFSLPFICFFPEAGIILRTLNLVVLKWSPILAIIGVVLSVIGLIKNKSDIFDNIKIPMILFYIVAMVIVMF